MNKTVCYFCQHLEESGPRIFFENDLFAALWDGYPLAPGHVTVIPKRHVQHVEQLSEQESQGIFLLARDISQQLKSRDFTKTYETLLETETDSTSREYYEKAISKAAQYENPPDAYNFGINDGPEAGQSVPHVHLHIIPRWYGDVKQPKGGVRNIFPADKYSQGLE